MRRDPSIPLFLWVAAAIVFHLATGTGVETASVVVEERADLRRFLADVRSQVRGRPPPVELELEEVPPELAAATAPPPPATAPPPPPEAKPADPEHHHEDDRDEEPDKPKRRAEKAPDRSAPKPPPTAEAKAPTPPKAKPEAAVPAPPATALPAPPPDQRVAIRQHVQDQNQPDNPNARQIADQANTVAEETRARVTSNTENDPVPTPGGNHQGSEAQPGNSEEHRVADAEDRAGEQDRAPRPNAEEDRPAERKRAEAAARRAGAMEEQGARGKADGAAGANDARSTAAQTGQKGQRATTAEEAAPAVIAGAEGSTPAPDAREARTERKAKKARKRRLPPPKGNPGALGMLGLGAAGTTAGGLNLNLTHGHALAAVGQDQLARERRADTERRKSRHRGSWKGAGLEKWRAAIENYVAAVKPGNQTALNAARVPFAGYLAQIHNRLHPVFADSFLDSLGGLPATHPLNDPELRTNIEIVLNREDGSIVKMGVTRHSGVTAYDVAALESVARAAPFGTPPEAIVSPDGNVYLHWEFHRNPNFACSTYYARPFLLKGKPRSAPPSAPPPTVEPPPAERGEAPRAPSPARHTRRPSSSGQRTASR